MITGVMPPMGLLYIASSLKADGHSVSFLDGFFNSTEQIMAHMARHSPEVVGISCLTPSWFRTQQLIRQIKRSFPHTLIVMGGKHATVFKERCMQECAALDVLVYGEGEETMRELVAKMRGGNPPSDVRGTIIRVGNKIIKNPPRRPVDLNRLPFPDRSLVDLKRYVPSIGFFKRLPHTPLFTSRGCPYGCNFCLARLYKFRLRDPLNVVAEVEECVVKYGVRDIIFLDETFTVVRRRAMKICNLLIERDLDLIWGVNARVDTIDRQLLLKMRKAGCYRILYGLESGVQKNLQTLRKGFTLDQARRAIRLTRRAGIETFGTFMFGIPGETFEEGLRTIDFACSLGLDYATFLYLAPFPGTEIYSIAVKNGQLSGDLSRFTFWHPSYVPHSMTKDELARLQAMALKKFYLRPGYITRRLIRMRSCQDLKRNLRGFLAFSSAG